ncbi:radical SAM protein [Edaphobacter modestus]|uniref:MoaA/NifB/PqqE/SkfB family radical SAM enzyme n=1 Tax=Edaphobacter modestus TaxID=388466 RepID=A0A4Q7YWB1_9BACT|nr:radical SAM protein [Edaphobacter modestus]RZU41471.1 MoaA/NifB/PqqE/SkfB family radical SAM enzyme [Edaphobacter modestus]
MSSAATVTLKPPSRAKRRWKAATRKIRELASIGSALASTGHPYMAHIVPMRRCNLSCTYCNEYDDFSDPVPVDEMLRRIDHLGRLGTSVITISGGEPLLHPDLDQIIARIRKTGAIAGMITNGYLLMPDRIQRLNRAGLDHMQISIDNVMPDAVSKKSLKVLDKKLQMLTEHAEFHVNINSVVGGGIANPDDARVVSERALGLGFSSTIGIIHDGTGQLKPLGDSERIVWDKVRKLTRRSYSRFNHFQEAIANGKTNDWRCRAGGRYLYVCENGLVHYCSQQRGFPAVPLAEYTTADVKREFLTEKGCSPSCTISCVHQVSYIDHWRAPQKDTVTPNSSHKTDAQELVQIQ